MATMTYEEQLKAWVEGRSIHVGGETDGHCVPDFSCCRPELLSAPDVRQAFMAASEDVRERFLYGFLGSAMETWLEGRGKRVHIAGRTEDA